MRRGGWRRHPRRRGETRHAADPGSAGHSNPCDHHLHQHGSRHERWGISPCPRGRGGCGPERKGGRRGVRWCGVKFEGAENRERAEKAKDYKPCGPSQHINRWRILRLKELVRHNGEEWGRECTNVPKSRLSKLPRRHRDGISFPSPPMNFYRLSSRPIRRLCQAHL